MTIEPDTTPEPQPPAATFNWRNLTMVGTALLIAALILFILSAIGVPSAPRFNLLAAGLACWMLSLLWGVLSR